MTFPADIKIAMRTCILRILWPKKDIIEFFKNNNCSSSDLKVISNYNDMNRMEIVDVMFSHLSSKCDEGLGQFRSMLNSLIKWSHFDPYYFDSLKKT